MDLYTPPNMLPRTIVTAIGKDTSEKMAESMIFFFRSMQIFQRITIGKQITVKSALVSNVAAASFLTEKIRDDVDGARHRERNVGSSQR